MPAAQLRCDRVPNMRTEALVYASEALMPLLMKELQSAHYYSASLTQVANVAGLPGIVGVPLMSR